MNPRFDDAVAVISGVSDRGIGGAIVERLAEEGASVVLLWYPQPPEKLIRRLSRAQASFLDIECNVTQQASVDAAVERCLNRFGRIDVLVNNAGIMRRGNIMDISEDDWNITFAVNIDAMFHLCRAVIPGMIAQGGGAIVNTASQWGLHPAPNHIAYNVSKAAVASFTQNLGRDCAPHKIRVNGVCPGEVHTPMLEAGVKRSGRTMADLDRLVPFGRVGKPEEIAALVAFLASDEAPYMCGSLVEITGAQAVA